MEINLTQNKVAIIDEMDFELVSKFSWHTQKKGNNYIATTMINKKPVKMHRLILQIKDTKVFIDHINNNSLDNRRCNLRICTHAENMRNRKSEINSTSKYLGVSLKKIRGGYLYWIASISINNKSKHIGTFKNEIDAAIAYNKTALNYHGEFANLNEI